MTTSQRNGSVCRECGGPLVAKATGRRPIHCSESCSSKAARQRRRERQRAEVAEAFAAGAARHQGAPLPDGLPAAGGCLVCGVPIRTDGRGRRRSYCGRSCSSKAYRSQRAAAVERRIATALSATRPTADRPGPLGEILRLAAVVQDTAEALVEDLDAGLEPAAATDRFTAALSTAYQDLLGRAALITSQDGVVLRPLAVRVPAALTPPLTLTLGGCEPVLDLAEGWQLVGRAGGTSAYWVLQESRIVGWVEQSPACGWHAVYDGFLPDAEERQGPGPWRDHVVAAMHLVHSKP